MIDNDILPNNFIKARRNLLLDFCFFGSLIMRLKPVIDPSCESLWTDGVTLGINVDYCENTPVSILTGVLARIIIACILQHTTRRGNREQSTWNDASSYVTNLIVKDNRLQLPDGVLMDNQFRDMAIEEVYSKIYKEPDPDNQQQNSNGQGDGEGDSSSGDSSGDKQDDGSDNSDGGNSPDDSSSSGDSNDSTNDEGGNSNDDSGNDNGDSDNTGNGSDGDGDSSDGSGSDSPADFPPSNPGRDNSKTGEIRDFRGNDNSTPASESEKREQDNEWKIATQQALVNAESQGNLPGNLKEFVENIVLPSIMDWRDRLKEFATLCKRTDLSWKRPNKKYLGMDMYLPGQHSMELGEIVVAIDTSCSLSSKDLAYFQREVNSILEEVKPEKVYILMCDTRVRRIDEYTDQDLPIELEMLGRGGTAFKPVFYSVEDDLAIDPACLVYLTDLCVDLDDYPEEPAYPVLWIRTGPINGRRVAPWGETVPLVIED